MSYGHHGQKLETVRESKPCKSHYESELKQLVKNHTVDNDMITAMEKFHDMHGDHTFREMRLHRVYGEISLNMKRTTKQIDRLEKIIEEADE